MESSDSSRSLAEREEEFRVEIAETKRSFLTSLSYYYINRFGLWDEMGVEDLVAEVMLRAWRRFSTFDPTKGNLENWLGTILRNRAINCLRDKARRNRTILAVENDVMQRRFDGFPSPEVGGLDGVVSKERTEVLRRAVQRLPKYQRELVLGVLRGDTYKDLATMAHVPVGTVKSRLDRAKKALGRNPGLRKLVDVK
ncbi:MAG: sigma-70 family RNA polymerase sigma factor [Patescibacteria group bacterium]|mgnify:CR=1 FL=1